MPILAIEASRVFIPPCTRKYRSRAAALGPDACSSRNPSHHTLPTTKQAVCHRKSQQIGAVRGIVGPPKRQADCFLGERIDVTAGSRPPNPEQMRGSVGLTFGPSMA